MRAVVFHPKVPKEARDLLEYYSSVSMELGDGFWRELWETIAHARDYPERHHFDATGLRRGNLKRFPIHFLFRIFPDRIRITVIRHDRRSPGYGSGRR